MNIFIYSDESGVFDVKHNDYFVFGGLIFVDKESKEICARKYSAAEKAIRSAIKEDASELKAAKISNKNKNKLFRSLNACYKFGIIIDQHKVYPNIFDQKKTRQRFLDYAYKIGVKRALEDLIDKGLIDKNKVEHIYFFADEHTTATDGRYELQEALEQELAFGTYNYNYTCFFNAVFTGKPTVELQYCNSEKKTLIRCADIIANKVYYLAKTGENDRFNAIKNIKITRLP